MTEGTGNVFADLGLPHPEQELLKALLTKQPQVSLLIRNRAGSFSVGCLLELLTALGQDVEIAVRPTRKRHGQAEGWRSGSGDPLQA